MCKLSMTLVAIQVNRENKIGDSIIRAIDTIPCVERQPYVSCLLPGLRTSLLDCEIICSGWGMIQLSQSRSALMT